MFAMIGRSAIWRLCVRPAIGAMLLSISLVGGVADAESLGKTKVRLVAINRGASIRISGSATIPSSVTNPHHQLTAANSRGRRFIVLFSLNGAGHSERFQARLNYRYRFAVRHATKLTGVLKLRARVSDDGQSVGTAFTTVTVAGLPSARSPTGGGTGSTPTPPIASPPDPASEPPTREREQPYVVPCSPPVLPALEPGMGVVTGSFHLVGGPAPGEDVCTGATVTVTTLKGETVGTAQVHSPESYAIAVPAGTYLVNAVATGVIVNGQLAKLLENREISVSAGSTVEIPVEVGIP